MWNLKTQLVRANHMSIFEMLMYGDLFMCKMENTTLLASSECMRLPQTHSVVISVLADLLMLTCSACLLGS